MATRPLEFVGFFTLKILTDGEALFIFLALDAYTGYLFYLGWEMDQKDETILKKISSLVLGLAAIPTFGKKPIGYTPK